MRLWLQTRTIHPHPSTTGGKVELKHIDAGRDQFNIENKKPVSSDGKEKRGKQLYFLQDHPLPYLLLDEMLDHGRMETVAGLVITHWV